MENHKLNVLPKLVNFDCRVYPDQNEGNDPKNQLCLLTLDIENTNQNVDKRKEYNISIDSAMLSLMTHSFEKLRDQLTNIASK